jgi:hypothetical protein
MTTDEIMALADSYADWRAVDSHDFGYQEPPADYPGTPEIKTSREALRAAIEALQADARRYRRLRDNDHTELYCSWVDEMLNMPDADSDEFDSAIDAAMALDKS